MTALDEELTREPRRRVVMIAKFSADSWRDLQHQLSHLATEIAMREKLSTSSISGGYSAGHIVVTSEDGSVTHDSWAAKLDEHLEQLRERETAALARNDGEIVIVKSQNVGKSTAVSLQIADALARNDRQSGGPQS